MNEMTPKNKKKSCTFYLERKHREIQLKALFVKLKMLHYTIWSTNGFQILPTFFIKLSNAFEIIACNTSLHQEAKKKRIERKKISKLHSDRISDNNNKFLSFLYSASLRSKFYFKRIERKKKKRNFFLLLWIFSFPFSFFPPVNQLYFSINSQERKKQSFRERVVETNYEITTTNR